MNCPICTDLNAAECEIKMGALFWGHLQSLMYKMGNNEFAAYLLGSVNEDGQKFVIEDYYLPEQEVTPVEVKIKEEIYTIPKNIRSRIIGHLHSHHNMGIFESGTDKEHLNYPLHIIIAHEGYKCTIRKRVGCGKWLAISDVSITFYSDYIEPSEVEKIKVVERKPVFIYPGQYQFQWNEFETDIEDEYFNSTLRTNEEEEEQTVEDGMEI